MQLSFIYFSLSTSLVFKFAQTMSPHKATFIYIALNAIDVSLTSILP